MMMYQNLICLPSCKISITDEILDQRRKTAILQISESAKQSTKKLPVYNNYNK